MEISPKFSRHPRLPLSAHCIFSGIRAEAYQWDQEMYDGSHTTFECMRFLDASFTIAITPEGRILLTEQEQPGRKTFLSLPGGAFDSPDEDSLICAKRELLEETGYESDDWTLWHVFEGTGNVLTFTHFYIARDVVRVSDIVPDAGEKIRLFDLSFDEFILLARNEQFHHHWNLVPRLYEAIIDSDARKNLHDTFYAK